jgi:hypothetical protein
MSLEIRTSIPHVIPIRHSSRAPPSQCNSSCLSGISYIEIEVLPHGRIHSRMLGPSARDWRTVVKCLSMTTSANLPGRPQPNEYDPYYERYISLVQSDNILQVLDEQRRQTMLLLSGRSEADGDLRYAPGKWNVKELLGHVNDTERIFTYRALRISRGDQTPIEGFEQDDYVRNGPFARRSLEDLIEDFIAVRRATISLFRNLDAEGWMRRGIANNKPVSVRAIAFVSAGHELHHRRILEQTYFKLQAARTA